MPFKQVFTHPTVNPVTLAEVKAHLRITVTDQDSYIKSCIDDAREYIERITGNVLSHNHYDLYLDAFPVSDSHRIELPVTPIDSIESIKYYDNDATLQTWSASEYVLDNAPQLASIYPGIDYTWPQARTFPNSVIVRFAAGPTEEANDLAQSGSDSNIVLAATDTKPDGYYVGMVVSIIAGKGVGQSSRVTEYVSSTKTATLADAWSPALNATSEYLILNRTPHPFHRAMFLLIGHWFENREDTTASVSNQIERGVNALITPYKVWRQE